MPDVRVERGTTAKLDEVDGDLKVGSGARITAAKGKSVRVRGGASFDGDADIDCDFACESLWVERGTLRVAGDLAVERGMDVAHSVKVEGSITADEVEVGGKLWAGSVKCNRAVRVGGIVEVMGTLEAEKVDVGGKVSVKGAVIVKDLGVGGMAQVGGGRISGRTEVGGVFESTARLEFGEIHVYGKCELTAGSRGRKISTTGRLLAKGDLDCDDIDVGGVSEVKGDCSSSRLKINGKMHVAGSLSVKELLEAFGVGEVGGGFTGSDMRVGGKFRASKILLTNQAEVAGEVETDLGMKASSVTVGSGSRCRGPIVGGKVELSKSRFVVGNWGAQWGGQTISLRMAGRMTNAEDIYGDEVILGSHTRARKVFARKVEVKPGCVVDEVTYTGELHEGRLKESFFTKPPRKVEKLPPFPL